MNFKSIKECERNSALRLLNFRLPNAWKRIGWIGFTLVFLGLLATKFFEGDLEVLKTILKKLTLVFLFIVVLSREKIEDERIQSIRAQAFSFTFLTAVLYVICQPIINYLVATLLKPENASFEDLGDFQILWFMLAIYLLFFNLVKRRA